MQGLKFGISKGRKLMNYSKRFHFIGVHIWQKILIKTYTVSFYLYMNLQAVIILENAVKCKDTMGSELHNLRPMKE
jgi:hypothetical protein